MKQIFISLCVAIFLIGCQHNAVIDKHLLRIDSFYQEDFKDSANILLNKVDTTTLSPEDKRYFYLLKAMQDYSMENQKASFVHLNEAERHYKKTRNSLKLFKTYLCKVKLYSIKGEYVEAARYGKEAERIAEEKKDNELLAKAYSFMATLNGFSGNYNLALLYGKKTLETGRRMGNKRWIGFALDNIACTFQDMGETDSCQAYIARSMEYVRFMPKHEQPWLINNIGTYYTQKGDYKKAEAYFLQAIGQDPQPLFVGNLANIYQEQGRLSEAEKLWTTALAAKDSETRLFGLEAYAEWLHKNGRTEDALNMQEHILALRDSITHKQHAEAVQKVQEEYDQGIAQARLWHYIYLSVSVILLIVIVAILLHHRHQQRIEKMKRAVSESQALVNAHLYRIEELEKQGADGSKEAKQLRKEIETIRQRQGEMIANGKERYEEIVRGGTTIKWHKKDFTDFAEYYQILNASFILSLRYAHPKLSPRSFFFLILLKKRYEKEDIKHIMGMSDNAYRTMKSRVGEEDAS